MESQKSSLKYMHSIPKGTEFNADLKFKWACDLCVCVCMSVYAEW